MSVYLHGLTWYISRHLFQTSRISR